MPLEPKHGRIPVYFPAQVVVRLTEQARTFGITRSDLIRDAVERGLPAAIRDRRKAVAEAAQAPRQSPQTSGGRRLARASGPLTLEQAVPELCSHIESFRATGRSVSDEALRDVLEVYATTLNIAPDDFDDSVAEAYGRLSTEDDDGPSLVGPRDPHQPPR